MEERKENTLYGLNEPYQNNVQYEQQPYGQNTSYGQNVPYGQNTPCGQNPQYEQQPYMQPQYNQPQYNQPVRAVVRDTMADRNGAGIAGFVIACFAIVFCWVPFFDLVLSIFGIVCSAVGLNKDKGTGKGLAIAGLIISIVALLISLVICGSIVFLGMSLS